MTSGTEKFNKLIQQEPFCVIPVELIFDYNDFKKNTGHNITRKYCVKIGSRICGVHIVFNPFINKFAIRQALRTISLHPQKYIVSGDICVFDVIKCKHLSPAYKRKKPCESSKILICPVL